MANHHRRQLLKFLLGSPILSLGLPSCSTSIIARELDDGSVNLFSDLIQKASEAQNVFDFRKVAQANLPPAHYGYIATGVLDDQTLKENEAAYDRIRLRMRRLFGEQPVDMSIKILGESWNSPIVICPCGSQMGFHPEGEKATARAAKMGGHQMMLSTVSTTSIEDVNAAKESPAWYQLYPSAHWKDTLSIVKRVENAGCTVLVLTVDMDYRDKRETLNTMVKLDDRDCKTCHVTPGNRSQRKPMINNLENQFEFHPGMDWDFVKRLKDTTSMKLLLKGIVTREDASAALDHGVDGLVVSNHGGRATESGRATIDCLPEVVEAINGRVPVIVDGGIRRGGDIYKALALGASAVGIGRPYLWGLGAFGQEGVEMVLKILKSELELVMKQTSTSTIAEINGSKLA